MATRFDPAKFAQNPLWGTVFSQEGGLLAGSNLAVPAAIGVMLFVGVAIGFLNGVAVCEYNRGETWILANTPPFLCLMPHGGLNFFKKFVEIAT